MRGERLGDMSAEGSVLGRSEVLGNDDTYATKLAALTVCHLLHDYSTNVSAYKRSRTIPFDTYPTSLSSSSCGRFYRSREEILDEVERLITTQPQILSVKMDCWKATKDHRDTFAQRSQHSLFAHETCDLLTSPIHWAASFGVKRIVSFILRLDPEQAKNQTSSVPEEERNADYERTGYLNMLPLHLVLSHECSDDLSFVKSIHELYPEAISSFGGRRLPLHIALENDKPYPIVQYLYDKNPGTTRTKSYWGELPIHHAYDHSKRDLLPKLHFLMDADPGSLCLADDDEFDIKGNLLMWSITSARYVPFMASFNRFKSSMNSGSS